MGVTSGISESWKKTDAGRRFIYENYELARANIFASFDASIAESYTPGSNDWFDLSGNGNHIKLIGTSYTSDAGGGIVFPTTGYGSSYNAATAASQGALTLCAWIKHTGTVNTRVQNYMYLNGSSGLRYSSDTASRMSGWLLSSASVVVAPTASTLTVSANTYYHVCFTASGLTTTAFYVNGVEQGGIGYNFGRVTNSTTNIILSSPSSAVAFDGNIYAASIYTRELTPTEIRKLYLAQSTRYT